MGKLTNQFKDRLISSSKRIKDNLNKLGNKLKEESKETPRGKSTSHIKHNKESYRYGGNNFKNRF